MNRFILIPLTLLLFAISCSKNEKTIPSIEGIITPVKNDYIILLRNTDIERKLVEVVDTIQLNKAGEFRYSKTIKPDLYTLQFNNDKNIYLAVDKNQNLKINITNADTKKFITNIKGSKDTEILLAYETLRLKSLDTLVQSVRRRAKKLKEGETPDLEKIKNLEQTEVKNYEKHLEELNHFIKSEMGTTIGVYATSIRWKGQENFTFFNEVVNSFEKAHPNLDITKKLKEKVTRLEHTSIGGIAPDIKMNNEKGELISLSSVHKKYTLIDFWASWCGPCRSESDILNNLYTKYKDKGFEIYGVSLDTKRDKWLKAMEKDNRIWPNVSSLEGFKTPAAFDFTVTALPLNYLIDQDYKIIGKNLHSEELEKLIDSLYK